MCHFGIPILWALLQRAGRQIAIRFRCLEKGVANPVAPNTPALNGIEISAKKNGIGPTPQRHKEAVARFFLARPMIASVECETRAKRETSSAPD